MKLSQCLRLRFLLQLVLTFALLGVYAESAQARDCTADELQMFRGMPADCAHAETSVMKARECSLPLNERSTLLNRVDLNRSLLCVCNDAEGRLKRLLSSEPRADSCDKKLERLLRAESLSQCVAEPSRFAPAIEKLRTAVANCSCEDGKQANFELATATRCDEAQRLEQRAGLWLRCPTHAAGIQLWVQASAQRAALCPKKRTQLPPVPSLRELFEAARRDLEATNAEIAKNPECKDPAACAEERRRQLARLSLFLHFFAATAITTEEDLAYARSLLASVGVARDPLEIVVDCSASGAACSQADLVHALEFWKVLKRPELVEKLKTAVQNDPKALKNLEELATLINEGKTKSEVISAKFREIPPEARSKLFATSDRLGFEREMQTYLGEWKRRNEKELRRLEIVIAPAEGRPGCRPFVNAILAGVVGDNPTRSPQEVSLDQFDERLRSLVDKRAAHCRVAAPSVGPVGANDDQALGCGPLLGIRMQPDSAPGTIKADAVLYLVNPGSTQREVASIPAFAESTQELAANQLLEAIRMLYDTGGGAPPPPPAFVKREHCGMAVIELGKEILPPPLGLGLRLERDWATFPRARERFEDGVVSKLAEERYLVGPLDNASSITLRLSAASDVKDKFRVVLELNRSKMGATPEQLWSMTMSVDEHDDCAKEPAVSELGDRRRVAGETAARYLLDYYRKVPVVRTTTNQAVSRLLLPGAEWWRSDSPAKAAGGVFWSVGDVALLGGGVLLVGLSINERNRFAGGTGSLDRAETLQYVGFGMLAGFLVERIVWGIVGPE